MVDQELLARYEYLAAENRILRAQLKGRLKLLMPSEPPGEIGHRLGSQVPRWPPARPETILAWYRKLVARKLMARRPVGPGRPRISREVEHLIVRMAMENRDWGHDRIAGRPIWGITIRRSAMSYYAGLPPAPERKRTTTWSAFIRTHLALLAGTDFFTAEVDG
jgi:hypothetical protein